MSDENINENVLPSQALAKGGAPAENPAPNHITTADSAPTLVGKIARLPVEIREELNRRLENGQGGPEILPWLNSSPPSKESSPLNSMARIHNNSEFSSV